MSAPPNSHNPSAADAVIEMPALQRIFDALPMGLIVFDVRLRVRAVNVAARALLPEAPDAAALLDRLCAEGPCVDWRSLLTDVWRKRLPRRIEAISARPGGGGERFIDVLVRPLGEADAAGIILIDDVTGRMTMQRRLAISDRMAAMGKVAARVAHELNNPLDGILRYSNLSLRRLNESGDLKVTEYLERIRTGATRMSGIVRDLLAFSRSHVDSDQPTTLQRIVQDAVDATQPRATESHVRVRFDEAGGQFAVAVAAAAGLFQVLCNLIRNAIDAMPTGGLITIGCETAARGHVIHIDDEGGGIDDVERIFEPFYTTKPQGEGTGLGLAVCREIVESWGGTITATNRPTGGARFTVTLPSVQGDSNHG